MTRLPELYGMKSIVHRRKTSDPRHDHDRAKSARQVRRNTVGQQIKRLNFYRETMSLRHIKLVKWTLIVSAVFGILLLSSYYKSKRSADKLVGKSLDYFELTHVRITSEPFVRKPAWELNYSHPGSFDDEFWIYTSLLGNVISTNPRDLAIRLREFEKLEIYPYSKIERK